MTYPLPLPLSSLTPVTAPLQATDLLPVQRPSDAVDLESATAAQVAAYVVAYFGSAGLTIPSGLAYNNTGTIASSYQFPAYWLPLGFTISGTLSGGYCTTASTADWTATIMNYGSSIGTVKFPAGVKTPVITLTTPILPTGAWVYLLAPFSTDATLAGISVTLAPVPAP